MKVAFRILMVVAIAAVSALPPSKVSATTRTSSGGGTLRLSAYNGHGNYNGYGCYSNGWSRPGSRPSTAS